MEWIDKTVRPNPTKDIEGREASEREISSGADEDSYIMDKNRQVLYEEFLSLIRDLTDTAHKIAQIEERKAIAVTQKRHELLEGYMKREQASILKLRGLDQHRVRLVKLLGWDSLTFSQIVEKVGPLQQGYLKRLFVELEQELMGLLQSKELAERIISVRIYEMMVAMERKSGIPYDHARNVKSDEFSHATLCDRYV